MASKQQTRLVVHQLQIATCSKIINTRLKACPKPNSASHQQGFPPLGPPFLHEQLPESVRLKKYVVSRSRYLDYLDRERISEMGGS